MKTKSKPTPQKRRPVLSSRRRFAQAYLFVNDVNVKELNGNETTVGEQDVVRILAAAAGG